ncbi:autotransporter domain-containing protein [Chitinibacter bivalviorum]|uniref:Autotransporter domain-containing protein n=2 Tax=Chitinibacter bivalviorum TaxID=2739434 RepID=A0A7H9BMQ6_9NEIS|nr:autotransporter domain-containing protein [Chitinibacter bivalviorum]
MTPLTQAIDLPSFVEKNSGRSFTFDPVRIQKKADGVLALMSYSVILDLASSSLSIQGSGGEKQNLAMSQLGGGATMSVETPLYLEGAIAYSRYDPTFVATSGSETRSVPLKWTTVTATGGIGWDFPVVENLVFRPIVNFSLGAVASDLKLANWWLNYKTGNEYKFIDGGSMNALGLGGALMLDYELVLPEHEIDVELRYSAIHLQGFANGNSLNSNADSQTANIWARWRAPTGLVLMSRPLRYVLEFSHSRYFGDQAGILGFDNLSTLGAGFEFDSSNYSNLISRTRILMRYMFGQDVSGIGASIAVSF